MGWRMAVVRAVIVAVMIVVTAATGLLGISSASAAGDTADDEATFRTLVNQERQRRGLGPLAEADDLVAVARHHSADMAERNDVYHNPDLASEVDGWELLGENVGTGATVEEIHDAFMASKVHRDVIIQPRFTQIGVGVVIARDAIWVTEVFRQPEARADPSPPTTVTPGSTAAPPVTATATPATRTAPAPATAAAGPRVAGRPLERSGAAAVRAAGIPPVAPVPEVPEFPDVTGGTGSTEASLPSFAPLVIASSSRAVAAAPPPLPVPAPDAIPGLGLVAAALLLAVVGAASLTARSGGGFFTRSWFPGLNPNTARRYGTDSRSTSLRGTHDAFGDFSARHILISVDAKRAV